MQQTKPSFFDSPYFVDEPGNWHLKPGAPEEVQKEFERFTKEPGEAPTVELTFDL